MTLQMILDRKELQKELESSPMTVYEYSQTYMPIGWEEVFKNAEPELELVSRILQGLGKYFPLQYNLFRAFDECPLNNVKVVILGQDPYHSTENGKPQANGMSFSTDRGCPIQPSLCNIYKELMEEYGSDFTPPNHGDLTRWANQGVLLLNTCLTVSPHQAGSHKKIWNGFITKVLGSITTVNPECVFLLWGLKAQDAAASIGSRPVKLMASHPSPFSANRSSGDNPAFIGCGCFKEANEYLIKQGKTPIDWNL